VIAFVCDYKIEISIDVDHVMILVMMPAAATLYLAVLA